MRIALNIFLKIIGVSESFRIATNNFLHQEILVSLLRVFRNSGRNPSALGEAA